MTPKEIDERINRLSKGKCMFMQKIFQQVGAELKQSLTNKTKKTMDLKINQTLCTKDGREVGNAIITGIRDDHWIEMTTGYGNKLVMSAEEVKAYFYVTVDGEVRINKTHKYAKNND